MKLIADDYNGTYVWVSDTDHDEEISPHFDYEEDAIQWFEYVKQYMMENTRES